jgi:hypothetical protein
MVTPNMGRRLAPAPDSALSQLFFFFWFVGWQGKLKFGPKLKKPQR